MDVTDTAYQAALLLGENARSDAIRGARLAALQTALIKAAAEENFTRTLSFHHLVREAEAFAAGLPGVARRLRRDDPGLYPRVIWADWLHGEHKPAHRRRVLGEFAAGIHTDGSVAEKCFLCSVKVLGEGVDTRECDSVYFADVRGSMPDLVQAVGRALRMQPGEGKVASLVVPVLLGPGETPETMLTSRSYGALAKLLEALRAHDARVVETLAQPQAPSRYTPVAEHGDAQRQGQGAGGNAGGEAVSAAAAGLLKFSTPRDPARLAAFIDLRVINPEQEHWRRGMEAAIAYAGIVSDLRVPMGFKVPAPGTGQDTDGWPAALAGFPLGQWIRDARKNHAADRLDDDRVAMLDKLGMVWNHFDVAFEEGLSAVRAWADEHGHALAPRDAVGPEGFGVGEWLHNARAAARRAEENERRHAEGLPVPASGAWEMNPERRDALEDIDPSWCPAWSTGWQRRFHLTRTHLQTAGELPTAPGDVVVQGEDLGRWVAAQPRGWDKLAPAQQWMLEEVLGIEAPAEDEKPAAARLTRAQVWELNLTAAHQYREREGHLNVPRKHIETVVVMAVAEDSADSTDSSTEHRMPLGKFIDNCRSRKLAPERHAELDALGMRWSSTPAS